MSRAGWQLLHCIAAVGTVNIPKHTRQEPHGLALREASPWLVLKYPVPPLQTERGSGARHSFLKQPVEADSASSEPWKP